MHDHGMDDERARSHLSARLRVSNVHSCRWASREFLQVRNMSSTVRQVLSSLRNCKGIFGQFPYPATVPIHLPLLHVVALKGCFEIHTSTQHEFVATISGNGRDCNTD
jgi:hypothetical protein